jgi:hypothetical protein
VLVTAGKPERLSVGAGRDLHSRLVAVGVRAGVAERVRR